MLKQAAHLFVLFILAIVLFVFLPFTVFDYTHWYFKCSVNSVSDKFVTRTSSETIKRICKKVAMTWDLALYGAGICYSWRVHDIHPRFKCGTCFTFFSWLCSLLQITFCPFLLFLLAIALFVSFSSFSFLLTMVLSVLLWLSPLCIIKLFLLWVNVIVDIPKTK